jgi:hypothetical protein
LALSGRKKRPGAEAYDHVETRVARWQLSFGVCRNAQPFIYRSSSKPN